MRANTRLGRGGEALKVCCCLPSATLVNLPRMPYDTHFDAWNVVSPQQCSMLANQSCDTYNMIGFEGFSFLNTETRQIVSLSWKTFYVFVGI